MNDMQGIPAAPRDRDLPNHRRIREELLMKIDPDNQPASLRRRWGLPLGVATSVAAVSVASMAAFGGHGAAKPDLAASASALGAGSSTGAPASPSAGPGGTPASGSAGAGSGVTVVRVPSGPAVFTVGSTATTPIEAGTVAKILASCLGSDASRYHSVIAVRTPVSSKDWDGAVIAVNAAGQYVQCEAKGDQGQSPDSPPTFINDRLWGAGHLIEYFDSVSEPAGQGKSLYLGAGHYTSDVAKVTISYGDNPTQYPAIMAGGAFFYSAAVSIGASAHGTVAATPTPYVHAFNASGKEIYNQKKNM
jgi:hypothetical protein